MTVADPIIAAAVAAFVTAVISGITKGWPSRPDWLPVLLAFVLGMLCYATALYRRDHVFSADVVIDAIFWGIPAALGAIGIHSITVSGQDAKRTSRQRRKADPVMVVGGTGKQV
jgi:RsiW-degrading membrane proteinase PrsW (M82 family)